MMLLAMDSLCEHVLLLHACKNLCIPLLSVCVHAYTLVEPQCVIIIRYLHTSQQSILPYSCRAMEEIVSRYPEHSNFRRMEDENTALHIAAANNKLEVVKHLCSIVRLANDN